MEMKKIIILVAVAIICFVGIGLLITDINYENKEISLREQAEAQRGKIESVYDQMWKIISQQAQVTESYKDSFKEIFIGIMDGRYSKGDGTLMKWIKEANPNFDSRLYEKLMNTIEIQREQFTIEQSKMLDLIREHKMLCEKFPGKYFISSEKKKPIEYTIISSTRTKEVVKTGIDDNVDLGL